MRSFSLITYGFLVFLLSIGSLHAEVIEQTKSLHSFTGPELFKGIEDIAPIIGRTVSGLAIMIVGFGLIGQFNRGEIFENTPLRIFYVVLAVVAIWSRRQYKHGNPQTQYDYQPNAKTRPIPIEIVTKYPSKS